MMKTVAVLAVVAVAVIALKMWLAHTREARYRRSRLIGTRGLGDNPKRKQGNRCGCRHGKRACGKKAEAGKLAEPGLCRHCRMHGPNGKNRSDPDEE